MIGVPVQTVCEAGVATAFGMGFTVMFTVAGGPLQPLAVGVMVKVTTTGAFVVLVSVPLILPVPLAAIPVTVAVLFLVQLKVVPATGPLNMIGVIAEPEQMVWAPVFDPQPLIPGTVNVPILEQVAVLEVPRIQPEFTTTPPHLTSQRTELSLNAPCASIKNEKGPFVEGTRADGVGGGLNP